MDEKKNNTGKDESVMTDAQMDLVAGGMMASGCNCNAGTKVVDGKVICLKCGAVLGQTIP